MRALQATGDSGYPRTDAKGGGRPPRVGLGGLGLRAASPWPVLLPPPGPSEPGLPLPFAPWRTPWPERHVLGRHDQVVPCTEEHSRPGGCRRHPQRAIRAWANALASSSRGRAVRSGRHQTARPGRPGPHQTARRATRPTSGASRRVAMPTSPRSAWHRTATRTPPGSSSVRAGGRLAPATSLTAAAPASAALHAVACMACSQCCRVQTG